MASKGLTKDVLAFPFVNLAPSLELGGFESISTLHFGLSGGGEVHLRPGVGTYLITLNTSLRVELSIIFVRQSAICALDGTHRMVTPVAKFSFISRACNNVRNS